MVVQLAIEIYLLPVSTANGIKFRFQLIKMSDRDLKFVYLFCQTDTFLFVIETPIGKCKHPFSKLVGTSTLALQLPVQSVFITTKVVNSNTAHVEVYSIQYYVIKVYQQLAAGQRFSPGSLVSSTNKTDWHDLAEILLKVGLNTITPNPWIRYIRLHYHFD